MARYAISEGVSARFDYPPTADQILKIREVVDFFGNGFDSTQFEFVPASEIARLKEFWGWHREFADWAKAHPKNLTHGETVTVSAHYTPGQVFGHSSDVGKTGRFLYMWGNIGRVITADGASIVCSFFCR